VDNTVIESFWSSTQRDLVDTQRWSSRQQLAWYKPAAGTPAFDMLTHTSTKPSQNPVRLST